MDGICVRKIMFLVVYRGYETLTDIRSLYLISEAVSSAVNCSCSVLDADTDASIRKLLRAEMV